MHGVSIGVLTERNHEESNSQNDGRIEGDVERVGKGESEVIRVVKVWKRQPYHDGYIQRKKK